MENVSIGRAWIPHLKCIWFRFETKSTGCQESVLTTLGPNLIRELDKCSLDPEHWSLLGSLWAHDINRVRHKFSKWELTSTNKHNNILSMVFIGGWSIFHWKLYVTRLKIVWDSIRIESKLDKYVENIWFRFESKPH